MRVPKIVIGIVVALILLNTAVLFRSLDLVSLPGEITSLDMARAGTNAMLSYLRNYANDLDVADSNLVKESIGLFQYKIETAKSEEEIAQIIINESRAVQETILREHENFRNQHILNIISTDPNLYLAEETESIVVWGDTENGIQVRDGGNLLHEETIEKIQKSEYLPPIFSEVAITIVEGAPRILSYRRLYDRLDSLEREVVRLQQQLVDREINAGYRPMVGEGIIISIYDAEGGYLENEIVHDVDVRDILNELFASGAMGASVGNQRIINTSSIRCIGPVILVNYEPIPVDPVIIEVVGDPLKLNSGMELIKNTLEAVKGIRIEIEAKESITLPAYTRTFS
jgi:hypothetical protein